MLIRKLGEYSVSKNLGSQHSTFQQLSLNCHWNGANLRRQYAPPESCDQCLRNGFSESGIPVTLRKFGTIRRWTDYEAPTKTRKTDPSGIPSFQSYGIVRGQQSAESELVLARYFPGDQRGFQAWPRRSQNLVWTTLTFPGFALRICRHSRWAGHSDSDSNWKLYEQWTLKQNRP